MPKKNPLNPTQLKIKGGYDFIDSVKSWQNDKEAIAFFSDI